MRSFIRWAGSKRLTLGTLRKYWPGNGFRYIEPFAGSACLFFDLEPDRAILGDLNSELIGTMNALKQDCEKIIKLVDKIPTGEESYYKIRKMNPKKMSFNNMAARFLYLNRYCFNGLYRTNLAGKFNVPYAEPKKIGNEYSQNIRNAAKALKKAIFVNADFETTLAYVNKNDFVYLDPPYIVKNREIFSDYTTGSFSAKDLERLSKALKSINAKRAKFLISYADSREARLLLKPWGPKRVWTRRNIAGFSANRRGAFELVGTNFPRS
jgi:DNA adenine methylase